MKFSEMPYTRPDLDKTQLVVDGLIEQLKSADSAEKAKEAFLKIDEEGEQVETMGTLSHIRQSLNTTDEFYKQEKEFFDNAEPIFKGLMQKAALAIFSSPFRGEIEKDWGSLMFKNIEIALRTFKPEIIPDLQEENKLVTEYENLLASAKIEFDGKILNISQITPYLESPDRETRKGAAFAKAEWFNANKEYLDEAYDKLVKLRALIAKKLGYKSFLDLGYDRMGRNCYDAKMVAEFRNGVKTHIVPVTNRLKAEQAERIGVPRIEFYDNTYSFPDGNPKPQVPKDEIFRLGRQMYHELGEDTGDFIDTLLDNELLDVDSKPGKSVGGYCAYISGYKVPFIFANFNGTAGDIDVLTHEAGHAFADYLSRDLKPSALKQYRMETAEVHSMSMELFTRPWMDGFFGKDTEKYKYYQLADALIFIPYGTMVDEFQHVVFENPDMTPKERNDAWLALEGAYRPYLHLEETPFFNEGRGWQAQHHIYSLPFYYIDYCLAQTMALSFWVEDQKGHDAAWAKYHRFVSLAGTKTFTELVADAGLASPFEPGSLHGIANAVKDWLDKNPR
ncbi:MAG: M3 family oligoendopeptidase [Clostridiales bacterium]|jgi:M3 family oligoendopeptidase|nr:M3 family oligoendopeptidase [Clostridiales bacterium]